MDRRAFLRSGAATVAAAGLASLDINAGAFSVHAQEPVSGNRKKSEESDDAGKLYLKFLGTGASGRGSEREVRQSMGKRQSSILLEGRILIDLTADVLDLLPKNFRPACIFYTHSHGDHYNPKVAVSMHAPKVYVDGSWYERALEDFRKASSETLLPSPDVIPLKAGRSVQVGPLTITPLPANHVTGDYDEQALIYLVEKGTTRLLYATDTAGIMGRAARMAGIDAHLPSEKRNPITALIMEATMPSDDYRIFNHSTLEQVLRTVRILSDTGLYLPASGQSVWVTHRGCSLYGNKTPDELDASWPEPLKAARDGMDLYF